MTSWNISEQAATLHGDALVWDNHGCMPFVETETWLSQLRRYKDAGVNVVSINIGDSKVELGSMVRMAALLRDFIRKNSQNYVQAATVDDIAKAKTSDRLAVTFDIEGAYGLGDQLSLIGFYYHMGVRWMSIAYNAANLVGAGCHDGKDQGLTVFGHQVVAEMDRVGLVKCCSHTGYKTAMDVFQASARPCIFSHSNPKALVDHDRNVPDELIKACAATNGVIGLTGVSIFLGDDGAYTDSLVRHIDYAVDLVGHEHVGIGLDYIFDQAGLPALLDSDKSIWPDGKKYGAPIKFFKPEQLPDLTESLLKRGYAEQTIRNILGENLIRVACETWQ